MPSIISARPTEFGALVRAYLEKFPSTKGSKRRHLQFLQQQGLGAVDASILRATDLVAHIRIRRSDGISPATALNELIWIGTIFKEAEAAGILSNTAEIIKESHAICRRENLIAPSVPRRRGPTSEELEALYGYFAQLNGRAKIPMQDIIRFAICCDLRAAEICRLEWKTLDSKSPAPVDELLQAQRVGSQINLNTEALEVISRQPRVDRQVFRLHGHRAHQEIRQAAASRIQDLLLTQQGQDMGSETRSRARESRCPDTCAARRALPWRSDSLVYRRI
jgi:hypothetical protein